MSLSSDPFPILIDRWGLFYFRKGKISKSIVYLTSLLYPYVQKRRVNWLYHFILYFFCHLSVWMFVCLPRCAVVVMVNGNRAGIDRHSMEVAFSEQQRAAQWKKVLWKSHEKTSSSCCTEGRKSRRDDGVVTKLFMIFVRLYGRAAAPCLCICIRVCCCLERKFYRWVIYMCIWPLNVRRGEILHVSFKTV